jgi:predicted choloylglycine hydrolase
MISDGIIKQKFVIDGLKDAAESAFSFQLNTFSKLRKSRTGQTLEALQRPNFVISQGTGSDFIVVSYVTRQLRFQDFGIRSLYTRPLYGALRHVWGRLQYGLSDDIRDGLRKQLEDALNPQ